jgi:hypothetical protein
MPAADDEVCRLVAAGDREPATESLHGRHPIALVRRFRRSSPVADGVL